MAEGEDRRKIYEGMFVAAIGLLLIAFFEYPKVAVFSFFWGVAMAEASYRVEKRLGHGAGWTIILGLVGLGFLLPYLFQGSSSGTGIEVAPGFFAFLGWIRIGEAMNR